METLSRLMSDSVMLSGRENFGASSVPRNGLRNSRRHGKAGNILLDKAGTILLRNPRLPPGDSVSQQRRDRTFTSSYILTRYPNDREGVRAVPYLPKEGIFCHCDHMRKFQAASCVDCCRPPELFLCMATRMSCISLVDATRKGTSMEKTSSWKATFVTSLLR